MRRFLLKLRRRAKLERDLDAELAFHREMARRDGNAIPLGSGARIREASRDHWRFNAVEDAWRDLTCAARGLRRSPAFTLTVVLTLALGVGVNTAIFGIADGVLFRPLQYGEPDRLFVITMMNRESGQLYGNVPDEFVEAVAEARGVAGVAMLGGSAGAVVQGADGPENAHVVAVTPEYFDVLGVEALYGRVFDREDVNAGGRPALLSHASWRQRFGGSEEIIGSSVALGDRTFDIIGVLPPGVIYPTPTAGVPEIVTLQSSWNGFNPIARLAPGTTRDAAQAEIDTLASRLSATEVPFLTDVRDVLYLAARPATRFLLGSAVLVFLIGCAHLTNLLLARSHQRSRETGIRGALGASRTRLVRPVFFEAGLLGLAGGAVAIVVTFLTFDVALPLVPPNVYGSAPVGVSLRVVLFAIALGVFGGLMFAVVPAWRSARLDPLAVIQGRRAAVGPCRRFGRPMVTAQVALSLVLVFGAIVSARTVLSLQRLGFDPENVVIATLTAPYADVLNLLEVNDENEEEDAGPAIQAFYARAAEAVGGLADVVSVGAVGSRPFDSRGPDEGIRGPTGRGIVGLDHVLPGYFEAAGLHRLSGRLPDWEDFRSGALVSVLSESAGRALYGREDPVGRTFETPRGRFTVIGVVGDVVKSRRDEQPGGYVMPGSRTPRLQLVARTRLKSDAVLREIEREFSALAPGLPVRVLWWDESIRSTSDSRNPRFATLVLGGFGGVALGLTAVGVAGLIAFLTAIRNREMGIRLALGAASGSLVRLMIRQTLVPVLAGIVLGLAITPPLARLAESQLFEVESGDPWTLAVTVVTVIAVALCAAWLPARRAGRIDPMEVLRSE